ncbi:MAG: response regulator [Acidobacteriota bacterium]|nr:response regulator [Blastocatellia bacterium]MDW8240302.1 response regulator [Acidobacteriota bacterium]
MSRILITDDEEPIRRVLRIMCKGLGHHVDVAENGLEAMERFRQAPYDLLITDLKMMPVSGIELVQFVRSAYPQTKIIILTAWSISASELQAKKLGIKHYFAKPFNREQVIAAIKQLLPST